MIKLLCFEKEYKPGMLPSFSLLLQAVTRFSVGSNNKVTKRRVETGFEVSDNTLNEPQKIDLSGSVGDINRDPDNLFVGMYNIPIIAKAKNRAYVEDLWIGMNRIRDEKMFVVIYNTKTGKFYENFMPVSINISDSHKTTIGFDYTMSFQEMRIGTVGEVSTSANVDAPSVDGNKGQGNLSDGKTNKYGKSIFKSLKGVIFGK